MMWRGTIRFLLAAVAFVTVCGAQGGSQPAAAAQKPASAPCPAAPGDSGQSAGQAAGQAKSQAAAKPCAPAANTSRPSAAEQFPFPGEKDVPATPAANAPTPNAPASGAHPPSAASDHPFPGEPDAGGSSSSSSSDSSSSSGDDGYDPATLPPTQRKPPPVRKVQTPDQRVDEDLRVAKFYLNDGDLVGAYNRAKDAVRVEPDYSETHFMLAEVARKMKKNDEAILEYQAYLKMDPDGNRAKAVKKALAGLR